MAQVIARWTRNGFRYWQLKADDAEVVASVPAAYAGNAPPADAKIEAYSVKKGMSTFLGYLVGEQHARALACFQHVFAERTLPPSEMGN